MRASKASLQARWLPWEVTQLRLGALTTYPLENGGQKEGREAGTTLREGDPARQSGAPAPPGCPAGWLSRRLPAL